MHVYCRLHKSLLYRYIGVVLELDYGYPVTLNNIYQYRTIFLYMCLSKKV